ncbi:hypothetical protein PM10SUCC1_32480 [Propionigenium maris DSM 9537]|uniref:Anti-CBASS protein Acb1-like N-terminal domain-containing protein n=1 Tax=Propionigenium maris DSM 9537 TaxID=1123000 RepID=A0A9W6GPL3_9FUSO|nr:anti-CBASS Acb1 family protein [Propionigenium maris]GLI57734.1 hypothetical protein PM10SUCC1_32480 [Propionigenium maris DSM 9537]
MARKKRIQKNRAEPKGQIVTNKSLKNKEGRGFDSLSIDPTKVDNLNFKQEKTYYDNNEFIQRIISIPILDAAKDGIKILFDNEGDQERFKNYIQDKDLDIEKLAIRMGIISRKHGTSIMYGVFDELGGASLSEDLGRITGVRKFNVQGSNVIQEIKYNDDFLSEDFGDIKVLKLSKKPFGDVVVHKSRVHLLHNRGGKTKKGTGISQLQKLRMELMMTHTIKWSLAEIAYRLNWIFFKTKKAVAGQDQEQEEFLKDINTKTQAFISREDGVESINAGTGVNPVNWYQFVMEVISSCTGIPKQRLLGQQKGVLAAGQEDREQYFQMLEVTRKRDMEPTINFIVKKVAEAINLGKYEIQWGDLRALSEKDSIDLADAKVELLNKLIDAFNKLAGTKGRETARAAVFELANSLDFDEGMLEQLAKVTGHES